MPLVRCFETDKESPTTGKKTAPLFLVAKGTPVISKPTSGRGKHKDVKTKLIVNEDVYPAAHRERRIPYNLAKKAAKEEVIPDDEPTPWCTNQVITPKPRTPYVSAQTCEYQTLPLSEQFKLEGATVFS